MNYKYASLSDMIVQGLNSYNARIM